MRLLLTGVGGPAGSTLASQLQHRGLWSLGVDMRHIEHSPVNAFAIVPPAGDAGYLTELQTLVRAWRIDAVLPSVSEELTLLAAHRHDFPVPVLIGRRESVVVADDKLLTARHLRAVGVPVPRFALPSDFQTVRDALEGFDSGIVVKPRVSRGGRGVRVITPARAADAEMGEYWDSLTDEMIIQEFAPGIEYSPVVYQPEHRGQAVCAVLEKLELKEGMVGNAVSVRRLDTGGPEAAEVTKTALDAVAALGLTGPVDIDIRRLADGRPVVLEINARFGANSAHVPELLDAALREVSDIARRRLPTI